MEIPRLQNPPLGATLDLSHNLSRKLVACYLLNENSGSGGLGQANGGKCIDLTPNKNHGILSCVDNNCRRFTQGTYFDGVDDYYTIPYKPILTQTLALTVGAFVYMDNPTSATYKVILQKGNNGNANFRFRIDIITGKIRLSWKGGAGWQTFTSNTALVAKKWYAVMATAYQDINPANGNLAVFVNFYLNGKPDGTGQGADNYPLPANTLDMLIGADPSGGASFFTAGQMNRVLYWGRRLSPVEAQNWANQPNEMFII